MSINYEKQKYKILKGMVEAYKKELHEDRLRALDMPIETENGFNTEREMLIDDIDEKLFILNRHKDDPYFAKLVFEDLDDGEKFNGYIGRVSIGEIKDPSDEKIIDWRAPISELYYNGKVGKSEYTAHNQIFNVDLKLKRQISIKDDDVESIYDFEDKVSNDEFLTPYLTQSADNRLKSIVATIQEEQNKIIRMPIFQNAIIQGVAGSGKTTVALHRLSYLMYNYKKSVNPEEYLIISPNEIFTSYISNILVDLEADKSNSFSLNKMFEYAVGNEYKILNKHSQYEKLKEKRISPEYLKYKNSFEFAKCIDAFVRDCKEKLFKKPIVINGIEILDKNIVYKYFDTKEDITIEKACINGSKKLSLAIQVDDDLKQLAHNAINNSEKNLQIKFKTRSIIESGNMGYVKKIINFHFDPIKIYREFIQNIKNYSTHNQIEILKKQTLDNLKNKCLSYDDLACVLYLYSKFCEVPYYSKLKCVFIDEAQDLSQLMFLALRRLFKSATFSIYGDIAQGIYSYQSIDTWEEIIPVLKDCQLLYLNRSYRTSIEIMQDANKTLTKLGFQPANNVVRHGEDVEYIKDSTISTFKTQLEKLNKEYANTAIICKDSEELKYAQEYLKSLNLTVLDENNICYGLTKNTLLTVQTAKGLEFDSVIIFNLKSYNENPIDQKLLYVAKTRALHKLYINEI